MRYISIILWLLLHGCSSIYTQHYSLSFPSVPTTQTQLSYAIGVRKVEIPPYMQKRDVLCLEDGVRIVAKKEAAWSEDVDLALTRRLITFLQRKFSTSKVYTYPWESVLSPRRIISVRIHHFIADKDKVWLEASWDVRNKEGKSLATSRDRIFEPLGHHDAKSIVEAMNSAFGRLEEKIAYSIKEAK